MSRNYTSDQQLIDSLRNNDTDAFEELFRRYWYNLYIYSLRKLHSSDDARLIVREIFKDLWEKRLTWPADFSLSSHLYGEVRQAVVKCLSQSLTTEINSQIIADEILPGFSVNSLQQAKQPVMRKHDDLNKPEDAAKTLRRKSHTESTIANVKWLFNAVAARLN